MAGAPSLRFAGLGLQRMRKAQAAFLPHQPSGPNSETKDSPKKVHVPGSWGNDPKLTLKADRPLLGKSLTPQANGRISEQDVRLCSPREARFERTGKAVPNCVHSR